MGSPGPPHTPEVGVPVPVPPGSTSPLWASSWGRGLFSQSPMKCPSSAHLLPIPHLGSAPQSRAGLSAQRDLSGKISPSFTWEALAGWGQSSLSSSSCFLSQGNSSTLPAWGPMVSLACGPQRSGAGERWWATCLGSGNPALQSQALAGQVAARP